MVTTERFQNGDTQKEHLARKTEGVAYQYLRLSTKELGLWVKEGKGGQVVGDVQNRPEDEEIEIDRVGENILEALLQNHQLPAFVYSEHRNFGSQSPKIFGALDPFDNSSEYKRGLDTPVYTVLSFYDVDGNPIAGGVGDMVRQRLFFNSRGQNFEEDLKTKRRKQIFPADTTSIRDKDFVLASYVGSNVYNSKLYHYFGRMLREMQEKGQLHGKGGAHIYAYLASGAVGAYVMFDEPRSEIDPGLSLARTAGCEVVSVRPDGSYEEYQFTPSRQHETVDLLVAACTPQLRDEIISYYTHPIGPRTIFPSP